MLKFVLAMGRIYNYPYEIFVDTSQISLLIVLWILLLQINLSRISLNKPTKDQGFDDQVF